MEILELKDTITEIKNLMGRPTNRSEMTRVTELKDRSIKMIKSEHQREKWLKQQKEPQRPVGQ